jgi:outer membrane protein assembly factor BamE (lipoprotein component of BamABCDE complex)
MKYNVPYSAFCAELQRKIFYGLVILIILAFSGCASVGREFPADKVSTIRIGETTQNDIYNTFGPPWRTGIENGLTTWTYADYHYSLFNDGSTEDLVVRFDRNGVVASYVFNTTKRLNTSQINPK